MSHPDTPNKFLENLEELHAISTKSSKPFLWLGGGVMSRPGKAELLAGAEAALALSEKFLKTSESFKRGAERVDRQIGMTRVNMGEPNLSLVRRLNETRDWALEQADAHVSTAKRYLREAKRLRRRVKWTFRA